VFGRNSIQLVREFNIISDKKVQNTVNREGAPPNVPPLNTSLNIIVIFNLCVHDKIKETKDLFSQPHPHLFLKIPISVNELGISKVLDLFLLGISI